MDAKDNYCRSIRDLFYSRGLEIDPQHFKLYLEHLAGNFLNNFNQVIFDKMNGWIKGRMDGTN